MSSKEWQEVRIGDICEVKGGKRLPKGVNLVKEKNSHPYIRIRDMYQHKYIELNEELEYVDDNTFEKIKRYIVNSEDVIVAIVGNTIGLVSMIGKTMDNASLTENCVKLVNLNSCISNFLYYHLISKKGQNEIRKRIVGTSQPKLPIYNVQDIPIGLPPIEEQKAIVKTLTCLDAKIELNKRMNKNLEEMAQAIFKSWFVDFEPFQDSEFEDSELGKIPKGWRVGTLSELISDTIGGDWGKEILQNNFIEEVICIRGADISEIACGKEGKPANRFILKKNLDKKKLFAGQIIIEISGGSPTQSTGRAALITKELLSISDKPLICTNFCRALSFEKYSHSTFAYSMLQYLYSIDLFFLYENGTTGIKNLDTNNLFNRYKIVIPSDEIMLRYEEIFNSIQKTIYINGSQANKLSSIRDTLLPKLMSGEIRVPIEEA